MRKGQSSVEYIVVLAMALVITMVAVGIMTGYIKLGTSSTYDDRSFMYWQNTNIAIKDYEVRNDSGPSTFIFQNNEMYRIRIKNVTFVDFNTQVLEVNNDVVPGSWIRVRAPSVRCRNNSAFGYKITFLYDNKDDHVYDKKFVGYNKLAGYCVP